MIGTPTTNLPPERTLFVGREAEAEAVTDLVASERLVTLTGPGGSGKTRLALRVATDLIGSFRDGVFFVELAAVEETALVPNVVAQALGRTESGGRGATETVVEHLSHRRTLIVLDNCEHVLAAAAHLASELARCPDVHLLATSRQPLGLASERRWPVPPLPVPARTDTPSSIVDSAAVRLFVERAQSARPGFAIGDENAGNVAEICRRLDGMPLAIELAAGRVKVLSVKQIADRIGDALSMLRNQGDVPGRHASLEAAIASSYDLLDSDERTLFGRLSVFAASASLDAARAVCLPSADDDYEVLDRLERLHDRSLVIVDEVAHEARYGMLETIRAFARRVYASGEDRDATNRRLVAWALDLSAQAERGLKGPEAQTWLERLTAEHDNIRAALGLACSDETTDAALVLSGSMWHFWHARGHLSEGRLWLARALDAPHNIRADPVARARALNGAGALSGDQGDYGRASRYYDEALELFRDAGDARSVASVLNNRGTIAYHHGDVAAARACYEESAEIFDREGDRTNAALALINVGSTALRSGDQSRARECWEEALQRFRESGVGEGAAHASNNLGSLAFTQDDRNEARARWTEALETFRSLANPQGTAYTLINLAAVARADGDLVGAAADLAEALPLLQRIEDRRGQAAWLEASGSFAASARDPSAARILGAAEALRAAIGTELDATDLAPHDFAIAAARSVLGDAFDAEFRAGRAASQEAGMACALESLERARGAPAPVPTTARPGAGLVLRREGEYWAVSHRGAEVRIRSTRGLEYLSLLVSNPGRALHAVELVTLASGADAQTRLPDPAAGLDVSSADAGPLLDDEAKSAYRVRIADLDEEIEEARSFNDPEREARARAELEALGRELARAVGLGGRDRRAASDAERARVNVTRAIRTAVDRIAAQDGALGEHLRASVRTGTFCFYTPEGTERR